LTDDLHDGDKTGQWRDFLKAKYKRQMGEISREYPFKRSINIDYREVERNGTDGIKLADEILENPGKVLEDIRDAIIGSELIRTKEGNLPKVLHIRFTNLPKKIRIRDIRTDNVNRFVTIEGRIISASKVEPRIVDAVFRCGNGHFSVKQQKFGNFSRPEKCLTDGCRYKNLDLMPKRSRFVDSQTGRIQENLEGQRAGEQPQSISIDLEDDLTGIIVPGERVILNGIVRSYQRRIKGEESSIFEIFLEVNSIERDHKSYGDLEISSEEEDQIQQIAKGPDVLTVISQSILPAISGMEEEKKGIALSLFSAHQEVIAGGKKIRGSIHLFIAGDPGISKTTLLLMLKDLTPRSVYISGKSTSTAGLTFSMRQDDYDKRWVADAGAAVMADESNLFVDELALMDKDDIMSLIEFMESQIISVAKAGINATLKAECAVMIAINPKGGRFDMGVPLADQIDPKIPPQVLSRCDIIYLIPDVPTEAQDMKEGKDILGLWRGQIAVKENQVPIPLLQKYIAVAKRRKKPHMTEAAERVILDHYVAIRKKSSNGTVTVTKRSLETLARLATAHSLMRFGDEVTVKDAEVAIKVLEYSLKQVMTDPKTGGFDSDRATGQTKERRKLADEIIYAVKAQGGAAMTDVIIREVQARNPFMENNRIMNAVEGLHREGILMEISHNKWRVA
jgi:replicative DNA helicase Mcm